MSMATELIARRLDVKGFNCPIPIVKTAKEMKQMTSGELIEVQATDPGSVPDFAAWSKTTGNPIVEQTTEGGIYRFVLKKR
jgi:tRNA 2-thiouridine synthesizing protein A